MLRSDSSDSGFDSEEGRKFAPKKTTGGTYQKLLGDTLGLYQPLKTCSSPSNSDVMQAFSELKSDKLGEKLCYIGMLQNAIYHAILPSDASKLSKQAIESMNIGQLENCFLRYYKDEGHNYFSPKTKSALERLYEIVRNNSRERSTVLTRTSIRSRTSSVRTTPTATLQKDDRSLHVEQEYKMFRENYAILLVLKAWEKEKETQNLEFKLTQEQFNCYQSILISFGLGMSSKSNETLKKEFGLDENIRACLQFAVTS